MVISRGRTRDPSLDQSTYSEPLFGLCNTLQRQQVYLLINYQQCSEFQRFYDYFSPVKFIQRFACFHPKTHTLHVLCIAETNCCNCKASLLTESLVKRFFLISVENFELKLPLKIEKNGTENSVGDISIVLSHLTLDINSYRPRQDILR